MNSGEYEEYVADVVRNLDISKKGQVHTNRKYQGVRQPGSYEIDIACEVWLDDALFFLIIVECKNWKTLVDRPQVQKLIQTRDAISAHKAAFASPVGYTKEAIEVAKANGVALWVVAKGIFKAYAGGGIAAISVAAIISTNLRALIYQLFEYTGIFYGARIPGEYLRHFEDDERAVKRMRILDTISQVKPNLVPELWVNGRINVSPESEWYFDDWQRHDPVITDLTAYTLRNIRLETSVSNELTMALSKYRLIILDSGLKPDLAESFMIGVLASLTSNAIRHSYETWNFALNVDAKCNHKKIGLLASHSWLEANRFRIHLAALKKEFRNNAVWANAIWLLDCAGLLDVAKERGF